MYGGSRITVADNILSHSNTASIYFTRNSATGARGSGNQILANQVTFCRQAGIDLAHQDGAIVMGNTVSTTERSALYMSDCKSALVMGNVFAGAMDSPESCYTQIASVWPSGSAVVLLSDGTTGCTITNNEVNACATGSHMPKYAVGLWCLNNAPPMGNNVTGNVLLRGAIGYFGFSSSCSPIPANTLTPNTKLDCM